MKRSSPLRLLIWLLLPAALFWGLHDLPLSAIHATLSRLRWSQVLALLALNALIFLLFSSRWWLILLAQGQRLPYLSLAGYRLSAFAISYFTPGTQFGGEPLQVHMLQSRHQVAGAPAVTAVTLDKLFELLANFTFLAAGLILALNGGLLAGLAKPQSVLLVGLLLLLPLVYLAALWFGRFPLTWLLLRLPAGWASARLVRRASPLVVSTERQISSLFRHKPLAILWVLLLSSLIWALMLFEYWLTLTFLGLRLDLAQSMAALTAARLAFLTPLPGGLGALEASQVIAMQALGISPAVGLSISLIIRARDVTFGALGLWIAALLTRASPVKPLVVQAVDEYC